MPNQRTIAKARKDKRQGKAPTTQAGEFIREEMHHIREGKHGARSSKQAIAIGLSKARRAGVDLPPPGKGQAKEGSGHDVFAGVSYDRLNEIRIGDLKVNADKLSLCRVGDGKGVPLAVAVAVADADGVAVPVGVADGVPLALTVG